MRTTGVSLLGAAVALLITVVAGDNGFMNAISTIADTVARSYAIGVIIAADVTPSSMNVAVVNRPDLVVRAHLVTARPKSD